MLQPGIPPPQPAPLQLEVCAGFANRLRATVSGICAAKATGRPFTLNWPREPGVCTVRFESVFDRNSFSAHLNLIPQEYKVSIPRAPICNSSSDWSRLSATPIHQTILAKSYGVFYGADTPEWFAALRALKPTSGFTANLDMIFAPIPANSSVVGVHIRRTDNQISIRDSPTAAFIVLMDSYPADTHFFVASDDEAERAFLIQRYGSRVITGSRIVGRGNDDADLDAINDFFGLARCSEILGSAGSSFSEMAAAYGGIPLKVVRTHYSPYSK